MKTEKLYKKYIVVFYSIAFCIFFKSCNSSEQPNKKTPEPLQTKKVWVESPIFNSDSAYKFIDHQVKFGPRNPTSIGHQNCGDWIVEKMKSFDFSVVEQTAKLTAFDGTKIQLRNILTQLNPDKRNRILLCAHWDTRPFADRDTKNRNQPILGANDGASGVGILIEIARILSYSKFEKGVDIVFFDAEDYGVGEMMSEYSDIKSMNDTWCLGSQFWSRNLNENYVKPKYGILLDMVGAENAEFPKEGISREHAGKYLNKMWEIAEKIGHQNYFKKKIAPYITDDHTYINTITSIPTLDIIDYKVRSNTGNFDFGKFHHTHDDNMEIIHKPTLKAVGETVLSFIYNF